jgi:hypothetical protein
VLVTAGDGPADWLRAGQALHRLLLRAASKWVFASLHTQPLEVPSLRAAIRAQLGVVGRPQMVMQFGRAHTAPLTGRRPAGSVLLPPSPIQEATNALGGPAQRPWADPGTGAGMEG